MKNQSESSDYIAIMISTAICMAMLAIVYIMQYYFPVAYIYFTVEDSWAEYGTAIFFLMAGLFLARSVQQNPPLRRPGYVLLCLGLIFIAMEEISWGQRLFGIKTPYIIAQHNMQSELTFHNSFHFPGESLFCYAIFIWAVIWPELAGRFNFVGNISDKLGVPLVARYLYPYFILGLGVKLFDIVIIHGEVGELFIGLAFFRTAGDIFCRLGLQTSAGSALQRRGTKLSFFSFVLALILLMAVAPQDSYALKRRLHNVAIKEYPDRGLRHQAEKIFQYIITREKLKNDQSLLDYGLFLKGMNDSRSQDVFKGALEEARTSARLTPEKPRPNYLAGKILNLLNKPEEAQEEFQRALVIDQTRLSKAVLDWEKVTIYKSMGETYMAMGDYVLAEEYLQKAYDIAEDGRTKTNIDNMLKKSNLGKK